MEGGRQVKQAKRFISQGKCTGRNKKIAVNNKMKKPFAHFVNLLVMPSLKLRQINHAFAKATVGKPWPH